MTTHTPAPAQQALLTDEEITNVLRRLAIRPGDHDFKLGQCIALAIESALLYKLRAPVADERISLSGAANLAFNALHECKPVKGAEKQYSDAIQALHSALHDIAYTVNRTATPQQFADHLQREARAALASAPVKPWPVEVQPDGTVTPVDPIDMASAPVAGEAQPVAWRYQTPTGWHATTDAQKAVSVRVHHPVEPLYAAPQASDAVRDADAVKVVQSLPRYSFGYKADDWGMGSYLTGLPRDDGPYLLRDEVIAALSAQPGAQNGGSNG